MIKRVSTVFLKGDIINKDHLASFRTPTLKRNLQFSHIKGNISGWCDILVLYKTILFLI